MIDKSNIEVLISEEELNKRIREMGEEISRDYQGKELHLICLLKGGVYFMVELSKRITVPVTMDFMDVSSYGNATVSSGSVKIKKDLEEDIAGKNVLVVEDIIDSGRTLSYLFPIFQARRPASLELCTMLDKPACRVVDNVTVKYRGFEIPDKFVVGFGLDYKQQFRNLPYIGAVKE